MGIYSKQFAASFASLSIRDTDICILLHKVTPFGDLGILGAVKNRCIPRMQPPVCLRLALRVEAHTPTGEAFRG